MTHISKLTLPKGNQPFLKVICEGRFSNFTIFHNKNYYVLLSVSKVGQYKIERIINNHNCRKTIGCSTKEIDGSIKAIECSLKTIDGV